MASYLLFNLHNPPPYLADSFLVVRGSAEATSLGGVERPSLGRVIRTAGALAVQLIESLGPSKVLLPKL